MGKRYYQQNKSKLKGIGKGKEKDPQNNKIKLKKETLKVVMGLNSDTTSRPSSISNTFTPTLKRQQNKSLKRAKQYNNYEDARGCTPFSISSWKTGSGSIKYILVISLIDLY